MDAYAKKLDIGVGRLEDHVAGLGVTQVQPERIFLVAGIEPRLCHVRTAEIGQQFVRTTAPDAVLGTAPSTLAAPKPCLFSQLHATAQVNLIT